MATELNRTKFQIEIACDTPEAEQYCQWLNAQGHDAWIGTGTATYVDGVWASSDDHASYVSNALWDAYCRSV